MVIDRSVSSCHSCSCYTDSWFGKKGFFLMTSCRLVMAGHALKLMFKCVSHSHTDRTCVHMVCVWGRGGRRVSHLRCWSCAGHFGHKNYRWEGPFKPHEVISNGSCVSFGVWLKRWLRAAVSTCPFKIQHAVYKNIYLKWMNCISLLMSSWLLGQKWRKCRRSQGVVTLE